MCEKKLLALLRKSMLHATMIVTLREYLKPQRRPRKFVVLGIL